jgi:6-phospho-beta-glucosidase
MLGLRHGLIGQETTGVGGFAKALRTIPPTLEICRAMLKYAADGAWLVNFTNPSGLITEAALKHGGVRSVGLCNGPFNLRNSVARQLKADPKDVIVDYVGANHLGWVRGARLRGRDVTGRLRRAHARAVAKSACDPDRDPVFRRVMSLPYNGYLNYFYYTETMLRKLREAKLSRAEEVAAIERELFRKYADPAVSTIPEDLKKRGGHSYNLVAANLIEAITRDLGDVLIVNVQNGGAVENIERDATVEVTCRVGAGGARPMFRGALPAQFRGLLQVVKAYEELAVEAGAKGDLEAALHALIVHPLGPTACGAARLLRDLLRVNRGYLPQFGAPAAKRFFAA